MARAVVPLEAAHGLERLRAQIENGFFIEHFGVHLVISFGVIHRGVALEKRGGRQLLRVANHHALMGTADQAKGALRRHLGGLIHDH